MTYYAKMIAGGKLVIPADLRRELGIETGDPLVVERNDAGHIVLKTRDQVVREVQASFRALRGPAGRRQHGRRTSCRTARGGFSRGREDGRVVGELAVKAVLDASAVLAIVFDEAGADIAIAQSDGALLSAVNFDEVLHKCAKRHIAASDVEVQLVKLGVEIAPFDTAQARIAAPLHSRVYGTGTSFADRACLALGIATGRPIFTCDGKWRDLELDLDICLIR